MFSVNPHASKIELARLMIGVLLFLLVANRGLLPSSRASVVAVGFACSLVMTAFVPFPDTPGLALRLFMVIAVGIGAALIVSQRDHPDPVGWWRGALILSAALVVAAFGWREKITVARELADPTWAIFSTFFNPNPLGGFLAMICPLALGSALAASMFARRILWGFCALILAATIIPTASKGAMVALAAALLVFLLLLARERGRGAEVARGLLVLAALAMVVLLLAAWRSDTVRARVVTAYGPGNMSNMFRIYTWRGTARMAQAYPITGVGPAAFKYAYPKYATTGYVEASHQNYLQMFSELGLAGGLTFLWLLGAVLHTGTRALSTQSSFPGRAMAMGAVCCIVSFMVNSLLEYGWYIGATNLSFWLSAGILVHLAHGGAYATPPQADDARGRRRRLPANGSTTAIMLATALGTCLVVAMSLVVTLRNALAQKALARGDAALARAQATMEEEGFYLALAQYDRARNLDPKWADAWERWGLMLATTKGLEAGIEAIEHAAALSPTSFRPFSVMGRFYYQGGRYDDAVDAFRQALALYPNHTRTLGHLAEVYKRMGAHEKALATYRDLVALETAPYGRYRALADVDVETNFAFAHYEIGLDAQRAGADGQLDAPQRALGEYQAALRVVAEYFDKAEQWDRLLLLHGRPREHRGEAMRMLEAKVRWRMSDIYAAQGSTDEAREERERALDLWSRVQQEIELEDAGRQER